MYVCQNLVKSTIYADILDLLLWTCCNFLSLYFLYTGSDELVLVQAKCRNCHWALQENVVDTIKILTLPSLPPSPANMIYILLNQDFQCLQTLCLVDEGIRYPAKSVRGARTSIGSSRNFPTIATNIFHSITADCISHYSKLDKKLQTNWIWRHLPWDAARCLFNVTCLPLFFCNFIWDI